MQHIAIIAVIVILIIIVESWQVFTSRKNTILREKDFMVGFWQASRVDCELKGYKDAYLYVHDGGNTFSSYIVAVSTGSNSINTPFNIDVQRTINGHVYGGHMVIDNEEQNVMIEFDFKCGVMTWKNMQGEIVFTWEKNNKLTANIVQSTSI